MARQDFADQLMAQADFDPDDRASIGHNSGDEPAAQPAPQPEPQPQPQPQPAPQPEPQRERPSERQDVQGLRPEDRLSATESALLRGVQRDQPQQALQPGQGEQPQAEQPGQGLPREAAGLLRELLNERDLRQAERARAAALEAELQRIAVEQQRAQQRAQQQPDPLLNPQEFWQAMRQQLEQERQEILLQVETQRINNNMNRAARQYGQAFQQAFHDMLSTGNPTLIERIRMSDDPGADLMDWHSRRQALVEIGPDPAAFKQKTRQELLADPQFRQEVLAAIQAEAQGGAPQAGGRVVSIPGQGARPGSGPQNVVQLPPSLSRAPAAAGSTDTVEDEMDDSQFFNRQFSKRGRGR